MFADCRLLSLCPTFGISRLGESSGFAMTIPRLAPKRQLILRIEIIGVANANQPPRDSVRS